MFKTPFSSFRSFRLGFVFIFTLLMAASSWGLDGENWPDSVQHSPYDNPYPPYFSDSTGTIYDSIGSGPVVTVPDSTIHHGEGPALPDLNVFLEIDDIPNETYSGDSICPAPVIIVPDSIDPLDENTDYKVYCSNNLNAGEATLVVEGIGKYTGKIEKTFYIEKASLIVRALNDTITYGDELSIASVEYSGFVGNDNENDLNDSLTFSYDYAQYDNVGKYTIIPSGPRSENYEIEFVEGELTVEPKVISIVWDDKDTSFTYDGKAHAPNATAENLLNDDECNVVIDSATNAGKYTAKAIDLSNKNYKLPKILNERSFEITKANPKIIKLPAVIENLVYNGKAQTLVTAGEAKNGTFVYKLESDKKYSESLPAAKKAGDYTIYFMVQGNENYNSTEAQKITATIEKAPESSSSSVVVSSSSESPKSSSSSVVASSSSEEVESSSSKKVESSSSEKVESSSSEKSTLLEIARNPGALKVAFVHNELTVTNSAASGLKVFIFDMQGNLKKVYRGNTAGNHSIPLNKLSRGMYLARVVSGSSVQTLRVNIK